MTDEPSRSEAPINAERGISRRGFIAVSAVIVAGASSAAGEGLPVVESDVGVSTSDGQCDAAFIHPQSGSYPGVLIWTDAFGLRPSMREMGKRIAAKGYSVLVPNPFYRVAKAPVFDKEFISSFNFQDPAHAGKLRPLMASVGVAGVIERDAVSFVQFLDAQPQVDKTKKIGTQGYCMGGPLVVRTAAAVSDRIRAAASFHGGGLVTDQPTSPHLLAPKIKARMYFGIASNDDQRQPDAKDKLREAFAAASVVAEIEVYASKHGWCVTDMPPDNAGPIYNMPDAERAWGKLVSLYKSALV